MPNPPTFTSSTSRLRQSASARLSIVLSLAFVASSACKTNEEPGNGEPLPPAKTGGKTGTGGNKATGGSGGNASGGSGGSETGGSGGSTPGTGGTGGTTVPDAGADIITNEVGGDVGDGGSGDGGVANSLIDNPLGTPPQNLKDVGIFPNFPDTSVVHPKAFTFEPRYPLYSNGLDKFRQMVLPDGKKVDTTKRGEWQFPVGTLFFKTFYDKTNTKRPIETRLIRRMLEAGTRTDQWDFQVWEWSEDGKTATLLNIRNPKDRTVNIGGAAAIKHSIPSRIHCRQCHLANFSTIIGFDEIRLNGPMTGQTKNQLQDVIDRKWLSANPAAPFADIVDPDPKLKWVREYMLANCGHCHNGGMTAEEVTRVFDLRDKAFLTNVINKRTEGRTKAGIRVVPGKPNDSILFLAFSRAEGDPELNRMPLVGVQEIDKDAVAKVRDWIMSLPANFQPPPSP